MSTLDVNGSPHEEASGSVAHVLIEPTYDQPSGSTAANSDLVVNRTETALGSGAQLLADFQVGGDSKVSIDHNGKVTANALAGDGSLITNIDASNISSGTLTCTLVPRNGTASAINASTPANGELVIVTDTKEIRIGDGTTSGGITYPQTINGVALGTTTATAGNILVGDGTKWVSEAVSGDATLSSTGTLTVTKTNGTSFAASATTDTTNATHITGGTVADARLSSNVPLLNAANTFSANQTISKTSGNVGLTIISDPNDSFVNVGSYLRFETDAGNGIAIIGANEATNVDAQGNAFAGATPFALTIREKFGNGIQFGGSTGVTVKITNNGGIILTGTVPTSDPHVAGQLWNNSGVINISAG
jgi:hypothetical protein